MSIKVVREQTKVHVTFVVTWDGDPLPEPFEGAGQLYPEVIRVEVARNALGENRWHVNSVDVRGSYARKDGTRGKEHSHYYGGSRIQEAPSVAQDAVKDVLASLS